MEILELSGSAYEIGLQHGEMWQIKHGAEKLKNLGCKYILKTAGDHIIKNHNNIKTIIVELGQKGKIIAIHAQPAKYAIGTQIFFAEIFPLRKLDVNSH